MRRTTVALLFLLAVDAAPAARPVPLDSQPERLTALGKVWLTAKFSHPRVALTGRDWDQTLVDAWPRLKAASDDKSFAEAVDAMLATIGDPGTGVRSGAATAPEPGSQPGPATPLIRRIGTGESEAVVIALKTSSASAPGNPASLLKLIEGNIETLKSARRILLDMRGVSPGTLPSQTFSPLNDLLISVPVTLPARRYVTHNGYRPQAGGASFYSSQQSTDAATIVKPRAGFGPRQVTVLADSRAALPPIALALQASGSASIVSTGGVPAGSVSVETVPLGGGHVATIRVADLVIAGRRVDPRVDATIASGTDDEQTWSRALEADAALKGRTTIGSGSQRSPGADVENPQPTWEPDARYADTPYPSEPLRLIAAYRLWGVIDYFFPYKHLLDRPWDGVLQEFAPRVLAAKDELEYGQVLSEMAARTNDSHVNVSGNAALLKWMGEAPVPVSVRFVEGKPVVTRIDDPAAAGQLAIGDEILKVDGELVEARARRIEKYLASSTKAGRDWKVAGRLLAGDIGSKASLTVRGANGQVREVTAVRNRTMPRPARDGDVFRIIGGNVGYADLERLETADVPRMFEQFRDTIGIVFDMRGYPRGTAWAIAPRINTRKPAAAALFYRNLLVAGDATERLSFLQELPPTTTPVYERPTVMLIDERAISQSEHSGLFFKAANGTTFIGSPTVGANGDVTTMVLPGGVRVSFTGHDVRWPDGRQLQRVGLVPDIEVTPTIAGLRAGRDEVLERALAFLKSRKRASSNISRRSELN